MDQNQQPVFKIEKLYVKDLSLEVPNAPAIFLEPASPAVNVELATQAAAVGEGFFEVTITVTVTAKLEEGDKVVFLVEAAQGGIFQIRNIPAEELEPILMIGCANILFPYARETISDAITRAGFQPVLLAPVNFEGMYEARQQELAAQQPKIEVPIQ
ncbi:protein-export chaperone SecB [Uliginosibacterium sp. 31-16]|uniref:protein-export chaperone SecB n=1 Tax=Uliginosibacterium sp. 31-16 TaxID=3068315 RepID=UPI00273D4330|nr:protein-export chaperone SecB [Uliginosibacterium sp. 31-16]MDP5239776.1 protein-export chaperone SecB [Uliginosibacterium sp. 31-16]